MTRPVDPRTGEMLKPVRPGCTIYSKTRKYAAGGDGYPVGGVVVGDNFSAIDVILAFQVASSQQGRIRYDWITNTDIDGDSYSGQISVASCRTLSRLMNREMAEPRGPDHLSALLALSVAVETRGQVVR